MTETLLASARPEAELRDWWALLKPRVMSLVIFTAAAGLIAAPGATHPVLALAAALCIAVGAGASGALNQWWDADIDAVMKRTRNRPVPAGRIAPGEALGFGLGLSILSVTMLAVVANPLAAALLAFTIFFYAVVYTMWLKRWTPQNIVIGGLAGALPPMIGWAAATGTVTLESTLMVAVIFLWTPAHFWALSLFIREDYAAAGVPMLPVTHGARATRRQVLLYAALTALSAFALAFSAAGGPLTFAAALAVNLPLIWDALRTALRDDATAEADRFRVEKRLFAVSIIYLFALFGAMAIESSLGLRPDWWPVL